MALQYAAVDYELREVSLGHKPSALLRASSKGTVPVLCLPGGKVIEESLDVMRWALTQQDPDGWLREESRTETRALVEENDSEFKQHLDHYKYWERFPPHPQSHYRRQAQTFLLRLEQCLATNRYLLSAKPAFVDVAIFPFVRQFALVDKTWFDQAPFPRLHIWLQTFLESSWFGEAMQRFPVWQEGDLPMNIISGAVAA
jgi:glutathione S-transferase